MRINIEGNRMINEVQKDFASAYPFLKIEFFRNGEAHQNLYPKQRQLAHDLKLKDAWIRRKTEGELLVHDVMTVHDLEHTLMDRFGLTAQVFRRSGNIWLETSITDKWTLKQQNDHGREITIGKPPPDKDENDYELNRNEY